MATAIDTARATATESPDTITRRSSHTQANGSQTASKPMSNPGRRVQRKYRHVAAVHSKPRTSCLSHDSPTTPSFIGFRNLMVLVLSKSTMSHIIMLTESDAIVQSLETFV
jgi:diacylglycerol O-acyltransferase 1